MKIALLTTVPSFIENKRLEEEVKALRHDFELINISEFGFSINNNEVKMTGIEEIEADVIFVRGVLKSIKPLSAGISFLRSKGIKIFDNNFLEHRYSIDKVTDILKIALNGIPVPTTYYAKDFNEFPGIASTIGYPVVMKSTRMGKGASVFKADNGDELASLIKEARLKGKEAKSYILQEMIPYVHDLRVLIIGEHVYAMKRIPAEGEFRANFSLGGSVEIFDLDQEGKELALNALHAINMTIGGVDVLITEDNKRYILEVNHTAGFVGMEQATGENIGRLWVEHAIANAK